MPSIKPISDLRNYTEVLKEVDVNRRVYLTRNGHGAYAIMSVEEADALDRLKATYSVVADLRIAEKQANQDGWVIKFARKWERIKSAADTALLI